MSNSWYLGSSKSWSMLLTRFPQLTAQIRDWNGQSLHFQIWETLATSKDHDRIRDTPAASALKRRPCHLPALNQPDQIGRATLTIRCIFGWRMVNPHEILWMDYVVILKENISHHLLPGIKREFWSRKAREHASKRYEEMYEILYTMYEISYTWITSSKEVHDIFFTMFWNWTIQISEACPKELRLKNPLWYDIYQNVWTLCKPYFHNKVWITQLKMNCVSCGKYHGSKGRKLHRSNNQVIELKQIRLCWCAYNVPNFER